MGLISKTVKVKWWVTNKKYYESKGYKFTKWKDEFEVDIEDIGKGCNSYVEIEYDCECCKNKGITLTLWGNYKKAVKNDGQIYCRKYSNKIYGKEKMIITNLKNSESLGYWLLKNLSLRQAISIIVRWDYEKNRKDIREVSFSSKGINGKGYWFKCPKDIHASELKQVHNFTNKSKNKNTSTILECTACNSFAQYGYDNIDRDFLSKYWDWERNKELGIDPWTISYASQKKVYLFCQEKSYHESYLIQCHNFINGSRCSYCYGNYKIHRFDSLGWLYPESFIYWSKKNKKSPYEYSPHSTKKVWWKCLDSKHKDYERSVYESSRVFFRCPECVQERTESILQEKTRLYLEKNYDYEILHEYNCSLNPKNIIVPPNNINKGRGGGILRYDNEILINDKHLFIEVMGQQHDIEENLYHKQHSVIYNTTLKEELEYQIAKDKYKEQCVYNQGKNYYYLAIWYYDFDKQDTYKKLIDNKVNEILQ